MLTELVAVLEWYRAMGADEATGDVPIDWLHRGDRGPGKGFNGPLPAVPNAPPEVAVARAGPPAVSHPPSRPAPNPPLRQFPATTPDAAVMAARAAARQAADLDELGARLAAFDGCSLKATATNLCFYRGPPQAQVMLIGEAPGRDEDLEGKPFVGRAGQLLDRMLAAIGLSERNAHITNIVYWRPPGNRTPTPQEAQVCRPFLERQIELVAPGIIVLLGGAAAKHLFGVADGIMRIRGKWRELEIGSSKPRALATLHPAYLLRTPAAKRLAWRDLLAIKAAVGD
ncbi:MAG TPA: uracil-DNA glycosylase [Hyphomicrobiaceae bacterium]